MKVVLFCGGFGMRLQHHPETTPKPMVRIGEFPILCHLMKYYAHFGYKEFILCLGWKAEVFKEYFYQYSEPLADDSAALPGGNGANAIDNDIQNWDITFVDTGRASKIGERLLAVAPYLQNEEIFLANYSDGLSDLYLPDLINFHRNNRAIATCLAVRPWLNSFHVIKANHDGMVDKIEQIYNIDLWINGGFFVFTPEIFNFFRQGDDLVNEVFDRLVADRQLCSFKYDGFWACMDTYKEKVTLDQMYTKGNAPWMVWQK